MRPVLVHPGSFHAVSVNRTNRAQDLGAAVKVEILDGLSKTIEIGSGKHVAERPG